MIKFKKEIAGLMAACMMATGTGGAITVFAAPPSEKNTSTSSDGQVMEIEKYLSYENGTFIVDTAAMLSDGYESEKVEEVSTLYAEINQNLSAIDREKLEQEKQRMLSELGPTERGKLSAAVKVIKTFLKEKWPQIIKNLPGPVKTILSAEAILAVLDAYAEISDSVEELLTNCVNAVLPGSLEFLTPGVVAVIMLFLPL